MNRSILLGPWIPLYGICGVLSVTMLHRFAKNPILAFCMNGLLYSVIGYLSDFTVQMIWHADLHKISQYFRPSLLPPFFADAVFLGLIGCTCQYFIAPNGNRLPENPALVPALRMCSAGNADVAGCLLCLLSIIHNFCVEITLLFCTKNNIIYSSQLFNERDMTMKKRVVVALGHRALGTTLPEQKVRSKKIHQK